MDPLKMPYQNIQAATNFFKAHLRDVDLVNIAKLSDAFNRFLT